MFKDFPQKTLPENQDHKSRLQSKHLRGYKNVDINLERIRVGIHSPELCGCFCLLCLCCISLSFIKMCANIIPLMPANDVEHKNYLSDHPYMHICIAGEGLESFYFLN